MPETLPAVLGSDLVPGDAHCAEAPAEELVSLYASFVAESEEPEPGCAPYDPAESMLEYLLDTYEWEGEGPTAAHVEAWAEAHADEIAGAVPWERRKLRSDRLAERFHDLRREGKTVLQIARKLGAEPSYLLGLVARDPYGDGRQEGTKRTLAARREHERYRAAVARRRLLGSMATRFEKELKGRDLADLPTKDLAHLLLKLSEVAREEEPPRLGVSVGLRTL